MANKSDAYKDRAAECMRLANQAHDPSIKAQYWDLAAQWHQLAQTIERKAYDHPIRFLSSRSSE
jgi:hypothetical protein